MRLFDGATGQPEVVIVTRDDLETICAAYRAEVFSLGLESLALTDERTDPEVLLAVACMHCTRILELSFNPTNTRN